MVAAVSPVSGGTLRILGLDPATDGPEIRARIGVCPQEDTLDLEITVRENLYVYGRYFGLPRKEVKERVDELLEFVQLTEKANAKVDDLSGGMKRRLTIARSLINRPEVLLLDEPTTGLDPQARHVVWDRLFRLKQQGVTLVLTTHYMDEAEQLADRLVVMDKGVIVAEGSPQALIAEHSTREVAELRFGVGENEQHASKVEDLADRVEVLPDRLLLYTSDGEETDRQGARARARAGRDAGTSLHARGRLPPADRPDAGGLMSSTGSTTGPSHRARQRRSPAPPGSSTTGRSSTAAPGRARRSRRSSTRSSTCSRWACCSATTSPTTRRSSRARRRTSCSSRPACWPRRRCRPCSARSTYPVMGMIKWHKTYFGMTATPLERARGDPRPPRVRAVPGRPDLRGVHAGDGAVRRVLDGVRRGARVPRPVPGRARVRDADLRVLGRAEGRERVRAGVPARDDPAVPVLGRVLPDREPRPLDGGVREGDAAVARRRPDPDAHPRHRRRQHGAGPRRPTSRRWRCSAGSGRYVASRSGCRADGRRRHRRDPLGRPPALGRRRPPGCSSTATTWPTGGPGTSSRPASWSRSSTCSRSASASARW